MQQIAKELKDGLKLIYCMIAILLTLLSYFVRNATRILLHIIDREGLKGLGAKTCIKANSRAVFVWF